MNLSRTTCFPAIVAIVGIGIGLGWPTHDQAPAAPEGVRTATLEPAPPPLVATAASPTAPVADDAENLLRYPDGADRPALNGVTATLAPSFTDCVPFAPVVGIERDHHGLQWYVHANGARSTSFLDARGLPFAAAYMPGASKPKVD